MRTELDRPTACALWHASWRTKGTGYTVTANNRANLNLMPGAHVCSFMLCTSSCWPVHVATPAAAWQCVPSTPPPSLQASAGRVQQETWVGSTVSTGGHLGTGCGVQQLCVVCVMRVWPTPSSPLGHCESR